MIYKPHGEKAEILGRALRYVQSVPYRVNARWLFYRLLQDGTYSGKGDYKNRFLPLLTRARKAFYGGWVPNSLADDTREAVYRGFGYADGQDWLAGDVCRRGCNLDRWAGQERYVELWFEAEAMRGQFEYYTKHVTLRPFRGDPSLEFKWNIAKHLEAVVDAYGERPIVILYFGDLDPKGLQIPESAAVDIEEWSNVAFRLIRCGLNPGDELRYGLPENPDKPGEYQWEALGDDDARDLILDNVAQHVDVGAMDAVGDEESRVTKRFQADVQAMAARWAKAGTQLQGGAVK